jgi:hypothetical protein
MSSEHFLVVGTVTLPTRQASLVYCQPSPRALADTHHKEARRSVRSLYRPHEHPSAQVITYQWDERRHAWVMARYAGVLVPPKAQHHNPREPK